jgi:LCP family protein required for cell wall assembly
MHMLSTIQREGDLHKKASLLKEYLQGEVHLLNLSHFLKNEIETSQSGSWVRYCQQVQGWIRKSFSEEMPEFSGNESVSNIERFLSLGYKEKQKKVRECKKDPGRINQIFGNSSEITLFLERDPETLKDLLRIVAEQDSSNPFSEPQQKVVTPVPQKLRPKLKFDWKHFVTSLFQSLMQFLGKGIIPVMNRSRQVIPKVRRTYDLCGEAIVYFGSLVQKKRLVLQERIRSLDLVFVRVRSKLIRFWKTWSRSTIDLLGSWASGRQSLGLYSMIPISMCLAFFLTWSPEDGPDLSQSMEMVSSNHSNMQEFRYTADSKVLDSQTPGTSSPDGWSGDFFQELVTYQKAGKAKSHSGSFQEMFKEIRKYRGSLNEEEGVEPPVRVNQDHTELAQKNVEDSIHKKGSSDSVAISLPVQKQPEATEFSNVKNEETKPFVMSSIKVSKDSKQSLAQDHKERPLPKQAMVTPESKQIQNSIVKKGSAIEAINQKEKAQRQTLASWSEDFAEQDFEKMLPVEDVLNKSVTILVVGKEAQGRADTVILSRFDLGSGQMRLLSFPRDTRVKIKRAKTEIKDKLSHTLRWGGIKMLKESLEGFSSIPVDYYVEIDLKLFRKLIDVMGGVDLDVEANYKYVDKAGGLTIDLKKGQQILDGKGAEGYVRFRGDGRGDLGRIQRQQKFISRFLVKLRSLRKFNWENLKVYARLPSFLVDVIRDVRSDIPSWKYLEFWQAYSKVTLAQIHFGTLDGKAEYLKSDVDGKKVSYYLTSHKQILRSREWFLKGRHKLSVRGNSAKLKTRSYASVN